MNPAETATKKFQKELNAGTTSLVLLSVLGRASDPMYGYQIAKFIDTGVEGETKMKQGALYPVLRSLERGGLLESRVEPSISGPPRRYYRITETGLAVLARWIELWENSKAFVDSILKGRGDV